MRLEKVRKYSSLTMLGLLGSFLVTPGSYAKQSDIVTNKLSDTRSSSYFVQLAIGEVPPF